MNFVRASSPLSSPSFKTRGASANALSQSANSSFSFAGGWAGMKPDSGATSKSRLLNGSLAGPSERAPRYVVRSAVLSRRRLTMWTGEETFIAE